MQTRSDDLIRDDVLFELKWDPKIGSGSDITVAVKDWAVTPTEIKSKIEEALRRSAELDARRIRVEIEGETVKLYGSVRSWAERQEAEEAAWSAPGTVKVQNHITIEP